MNKIYFLVLTVLSLHTIQAQNIYRVTEGGAGAKDGSSWDNAYDNLQTAIDNASPNDEIWVAEGTYTGGFEIKEGINVYGSFAGNETQRSSIPDTTSYKTILDGINTQRVLTQTTAFSTPTIWSGFTITNGNATNADFDSEAGGGAYILEGTTLMYCRITNNVASTLPGSIQAFGGGIYSWKGNVINCIIDNNIAYEGSADASAQGGGALISEGILSHCIISGNIAYKGVGNTGGSGKGGGVISPMGSTISNCLVVRNMGYITDGSADPSSSGAGIYLDGETTVFNCTITGNKTILSGTNSSSTGGGGVCIYSNTNKIYNSIIWDNYDSHESGKDVFDYFGHADFDIKNCIYSEAVEDDGNKSSNPTLSTDYYLTSASPAIEAGDNSLYTGNINADKDLANNPRLVGDKIDIGAYEYQDEVIPPTPPGSIVYVDKSQTGSEQNGSSWANAFSSLYDAFETAANYPDNVREIRIAYGEYLINSGALVVSSDVVVTGGLNPSSPVPDSVTILNGNNMNRVLIISGKNIEPDDYISPEFHNLVIAKGEADEELIINNNLIDSHKGGGIYITQANPLFMNTVITENNAESGGGIYVDKGELRLMNTTINRNSATNGGGIYSLANYNNIQKSIIWGNTSNNEDDRNLFILPGAIHCWYSLIEGRSSDDETCLNGTNQRNNPMLTKVGDYYYGLLPSSPVINKGAGLEIYTETATDVHGNHRVFNHNSGGAVDMGAFEFQGEAPLLVTFPGYAKPDSITGYQVDSTVYSQISDTTWTAGYNNDFAFRLNFAGKTDSSYYTVTVGTDTLKSANGAYTIKNVTANKSISIRANTYAISFPDSLPTGIKGIKTLANSDSLATQHGSTYQFQVMLDSAYVKITPVIKTKEGVKVDSVQVDSVGVWTYQIANVRQNLHIVIDSLKQSTPDSCIVTIPAITGLITDPKAGEHKVAYGDSLVLNFRLDEGYKEFDLNLIINGDSIQNFVSDPALPETEEPEILPITTYSIKLRSDSTYTYVIKDIKQNLVIKFNGTIDDEIVSKEPVVEDNGTKIYAYEGYLYIEAPKACRLNVYTITGRMYTDKPIPAGTINLQVPKGIYIVRAGDVIKKVLVK